jgi:hypothetical protein
LETEFEKPQHAMMVEVGEQTHSAGDHHLLWLIQLSGRATSPDSSEEDGLRVVAVQKPRRVEKPVQTTTTTAFHDNNGCWCAKTRKVFLEKQFLQKKTEEGGRCLDRRRKSCA